MNDYRSLRVLLLQARAPNDPAREHEVDCFARHTQLELSQFTCFDLLEAAPTAADLNGHDAVMVGGSGEFYVSAGNLPHVWATLDFLRETAATGHPTFASCFGYQLFVEALGGTIVFDPDNTEVGTFDLELTDSGREDPLFGDLPALFPAQMGHKDRAAAHPEGIPNLARSSRSPNQALRIPGQPVWAAQFHPELNRKANQERFMRYAKGYARVMNAEETQAVVDSFRESPATDSLLRRFIELVF